MIVYYLIIINVIGFALMGLDKKKAINHQWRIPEKHLMLVAIIGGSIGSVIGMNTFRHKIKKAKFYIGLPLIIMAQVILLWQIQ